MKSIITIFILSALSFSCFGIESLDGFLVQAFDQKFKIISPQKFKNKMEVIVENKTLTKLVGKISINKKEQPIFFSVMPEQYEKKIIELKKGDVLHFVPLSPPFQEVELIVGNKNYEIPPAK